MMRTLFAYICTKHLLDAWMCRTRLDGCRIGCATGAVVTATPAVAALVLTSSTAQLEAYLLVAIPEAATESI